MTNFSTIAERIGKTTSEKKAVEAMANDPDYEELFDE